MARLEVRPVRGLWGRHQFVDVPFGIHGADPGWVPPLRLTVYDRISPRHPSAAHQQTALWVALRHGRPVGRIGACVDTAFDAYQDVRWGWVGFYESFDDPDVAAAMFETACGWTSERGAETCIGPANFTTNDELGLMIEGFDRPPVLMTVQNPPYYQGLWEGAGWEPAADLYGWHFDNAAALSERQRRTLNRIRDRAKVRARILDLQDWDAEVGRFFDVYNAAWGENWGFAPMPEAEVRHLAKQLKPIINPEWAVGLETTDGELVGVCLALPDLNQPMRRVRSGRLLPIGWIPLLFGRRKIDAARVWALGIKPGYQHLALGPLLYHEIVDRLVGNPQIQSAEASWTLATNHRINDQIEAMGGKRSRVWRMYGRPAARPGTQRPAARPGTQPQPSAADS